MSTMEENVITKNEKDRLNTAIRNQLCLYSMVILVLLCGIYVLSWYEASAKTVTESYIRQICDNKSMELDEELKTSERLVELLSADVLAEVKDIEEITNEKKRGRMLAKLAAKECAMVEQTDFVEKMYIQLAPELAGPTSGVAMRKTEDGVKQVELLDVSSYAATDLEKLEWYSLPIRNEGSLWLDPYEDKEIAAEILSYVMPLYSKGVAVGVVGVDIRVSHLVDKIDTLQLLNKSYATLSTNNGEVVTRVEKVDKEEYVTVCGSLTNKMLVTLYAPKTEVNALCSHGFYFGLRIILMGMLLSIVVHYEVRMLSMERKEGSKPHMRLPRRCIQFGMLAISLLMVILFKMQVAAAKHSTEKVLSEDIVIDIVSVTVFVLLGVMLIVFCVCEWMNNKEKNDQMKEKDPVTGLCNLASGEVKIENAREEEIPGLLLVCSVDEYEDIRENFGQEIADGVQRSLAQCMRASFRDGDILMVAQENVFVVYAVHVECIKDGKKIVERFFERINKKRVVELNGDSITISLACVHYGLEREEKFSEVLERAKELLVSSEEIEGNSASYEEQ